jgi:hypothetical protein
MVMPDKEAEANAVARQLNRIAEREYANQTAALRKLTLTGEGRDLLWWLLRIGRVGLQPFALDPYQHAFNSGELNVCQQILARIIEAEPAGYLRLLEDQINADRERTTLSREQVISEPDSDSTDG